MEQIQDFISDSGPAVNLRFIKFLKKTTICKRSKQKKNI